MAKSRINVRALRNAMGLTVEDMAAKIGVTERTWSRWENGHYAPSPLALTRLRELQQPDVPKRRSYDSVAEFSRPDADSSTPAAPRGIVPSRRLGVS